MAGQKPLAPTASDRHAGRVPNPENTIRRRSLRSRRLPRRITQLYAGLGLYGFSMGLFVRSDLGVMPWDVLHQGLSRQLGGSIGQWTIAIGALVLLFWVPLRQRPGLGTISNVIVLGVVLDLTLLWLPQPDGLALRILAAVLGLVLNSLATAMYVGAQLGPGPRDGLMTGLVARTGGSIRLIRTTIEVTVVALGWVLGGTLGFATVAYALGIGLLVQPLLPRLSVGPATLPE